MRLRFQEGQGSNDCVSFPEDLNDDAPSGGNYSGYFRKIFIFITANEKECIYPSSHSAFENERL